MVATPSFKVAYIGGGSRFVVTFLHGLAAYVDSIKALDIPIFLVLMDPDLSRAKEMAQYAGIVAKQTGLPLTVEVTSERRIAISEANLVIYSVGVQERLNAIRTKFAELLGENVETDSCPGMAMEGVNRSTSRTGCENSIGNGFFATLFPDQYANARTGGKGANFNGGVFHSSAMGKKEKL